MEQQTADQKVTKIKSEDVFYEIPNEIGLSRCGVPSGFELIKKADQTIECSARAESMAKHKLAQACKKYGANVILDYSAERFVRNSIGFSFYMYRVSGYPAVMAKISKDGSFSREELEDSLNTAEIYADAKRRQSVKKGNFILKLLACAMALFFLAGFLMSK